MKKFSLKDLHDLPKMYYNVPPCPQCGSRRTGRYLRKPISIDPEDERSMVEKCLKHGELIRFSWMVPIRNAYCEDCGHEWAQNIRVELVSPERIMEEAAARGTMEELERYSENHKKRKKSVFGRIFGYLP